MVGSGLPRRGVLTAGALALLAGCSRTGAGPETRTTPSGPTSSATTAAEVDPDAPTRAQVAALLTRRADGLRRGDAAASSAVYAAAVREAVAAVDARAAALGLAEVDLTLLDVRPVDASAAGAASGNTSGAAGDGERTPVPTHEAAVATAVRITGEGRAAGGTQRVGLVRSAGGDAEGGGDWVLVPAVEPGVPQPWELGDVEARRVDTGVVVRVAVGAEDGGTAEATDRADQLSANVAEDLPDATARVRRHWGTDWPDGTAVVVCSTPVAAGRLAGVDAERALALDALAVGLDGTLPGGGPAGVRVVVQPSGFGALSRLGQQVTLTHELVHVAARAGTTASLPVWLVEGYADHVARLDRGLDPRRLAVALLDAVAAGRSPEVPDETAYASTDPAELQIAYASGWTLVTSAARAVGTPAVTAFYRDLARPTGPAPDPADLPDRVDAAARRHLGASFAEVRDRWVAEVRGGLADWT